MKQKLIILIGPPASGKTTWAKDYVSNNKNSVRVCRDDFRYHFTPHWEFNRRSEGVITTLEDVSVYEWLLLGKSVIVDATNLRTDSVDRFRNIADSFTSISVESEIKVFDVALETCIQRNSNRTGNEYVPLDILKNMHKKFKQLKETL